MDPLASWFAISIVVERLVEIISRMFPIINEINVKFVEPKIILALVLGVLFSFGANLDFFAMFGIYFRILYVGESVSAIFIAAGSTYVHGIITEIHTSRSRIDEKELNSKVKAAVKNLNTLRKTMGGIDPKDDDSK